MTSEGNMLANNFVDLCGQGAPLAAVGLFLAPLPTIQQLAAAGTVGGLPLLPYTTMASNAFLWTTYGVLKKESKVWSCNGFGFFCALYYCFKFVNNIPKPKATSILDASTPALPGTVRQHFQAVAAFILATILLAVFKPFANTANLIGNVAVLVCIAMFASPLAVLKQVIATKSAKSIPLPFTIVSCLNCGMWTTYGWFRMHDFNIYFPNFLGLLCGIAQVALKLLYGGGEGLPKTPIDVAP